MRIKQPNTGQLNRISGDSNRGGLAHGAADEYTRPHANHHTNAHAGIAPVDDGRLLRDAIVVAGFEASVIYR